MPPPPEQGLRAGLDLRLVPAAGMVWSVAVVTIMWPSVAYGVATVALLCAAGVVAIWRHRAWRWGRWAVARGWQATTTVLMPAVAVACTAVATRVRIVRAQHHEIYDDIGGIATVQLRLVAEPRPTEFGASAKARIEGLPGEVPVFADESLLAISRDTVIESAAAVRAATKPSISGIQLNLKGNAEVIAPPTGVASQVRQVLFDTAQRLPSGPDRMIPAMAIGDERGFSLEDRQMMVSSGLSHLSAVSGANVALVVGAVVALFFWASPRVRVGAAAISLCAFVAVVGTEPSVLRAVVTGCIGLLAILLGRPGQAIAALSAGVIGLVLIEPDLAVSVGFALSVFATAGLVLLAEPLARQLSATTVMAAWPAPIVRAISVSIAAHVVTMPILALFIGEISQVSLPANLLAAPAVAPVTIAGSLAAVAAAFHATWLVTALLWCAAPFAWWIYRVAHVASHAVTPTTGAAELIVSCVVTGACLTTLWLWPRITLRSGLVLSIVATCSYGIIWVFGLDIPRAPVGWDVAACMDNEELLIFRRTTEKTAKYDSSARGRDSPEVSRHCRIALGLAENQSLNLEQALLSIEPLDPAVADTQVVESPSYADAALSTSDVRSQPRWLVAQECGPRVRSVVITPEHIPVVCPARDGPQALYPTGAVWRGS
ncbi:MAG: ComEC/Rec2 family competence protein [Corynebacterium sp.]|uniref:ComEC/Rec2 family competence protein n=1 Tax=Corynebacterium sp. TaxID=1720 RepID=UPI0026DC6F43|nr:ComEC/Rec2 family competence protein [Corynebacterium sp.]MDO5030985.1 ComEC/Rec2 family competence protein [Corynebacterium sp.]